MEELIEYLYKVVNGLEVSQVVVVKVNTDAEVETSVATVDNLEVTKLYKLEFVCEECVCVHVRIYMCQRNVCVCVCVWGGGGGGGIQVCICMCEYSLANHSV